MSLVTGIYLKYSRVEGQQEVWLYSEHVPVLPSGYSVSEGWLAYNGEWDKTAELQSDSEEGNND